MSTFSLSHLNDHVLSRDLTALVVRDRTTTAALLAHLAEFDTRRLYAPAGYPSMFGYCVGELHLSEDSAYKRIRGARTARQFPAIFAALADGSLSLSAVILLTPYLTPETADDLLAAATHKSKSELEQLLAARFPRPDVPAMVRAISPPPSTGQLAPGPVEQRASGRVAGFAQRPVVKPLAPERFALQFTFVQAAHDKLRYAQALLGHQVPSGELAQLFERALDALIGQLEKRKFAATTQPRPRLRRSSADPRYIPADVKRTVWERDGGQCTFVSQAGQRCPARTMLEFDHIDPVALGGQATVGRMRLRCRAHNQYEAERTFGAGFMSHKRQAARRAATEIRARVAANEQATDVLAGLRQLGFGADEARRAVEFSGTHHVSSLEERMRAALSFFAKRSHGGATRIHATAT